MQTKISPIPYLPDPWLAYSAELCQDYGFVLTGGRYSILGWDPLEVVTEYSPDHIHTLNEKLKSIHSDFTPCGGWYGYLGYELAESLHPHLEPRPRDLPLPDLCLGLYDQVLVFDHQQMKAFEVTHPSLRATASLRGGCTRRSNPAASQQSKPMNFTSNLDENAYQNAFQEVQSALQRGDCYQVNLAQRFTSTFEGSPWAYFLSLLKSNPAPFAAYFQLPGASIISCSPERFIRIDKNKILTQPIKGTAPRDPDPLRDQALAQELFHSVKNRAENLMIVDLMRNDLGKICQSGSIQVPKLFDIESYPSVHHLVSTITGVLRPELSPLEALFSCFPGGSITGAPKLSALQLIRKLEPQARHVYCGSIGYADFSDTLDMNIAIRTAVITQGACHVWAGGGLVLDSNWEDEYNECFHKVKILLKNIP